MSMMQTAAGDSGVDLPAARWSDLPDDLLGIVRFRIASPRDRMCISAVCKSWRAVASRQPARPALPLLLLSPWENMGKGHLCDPDYSWAFHALSKAVDKVFLGSYDGGWVAAFDYHALIIVNIFSGVEVKLSPKQTMVYNPLRRHSPPRHHCLFEKIVFSRDPTSPDGCILAAIEKDRSGVALCKLGCPDGEWTRPRWEEESVTNIGFSNGELYAFGALWHGESVTDIAFCNGELYALAKMAALTGPLKGQYDVLIKLEIGMKRDGTPVIAATHLLTAERSARSSNRLTPDRYIFELHGKPSMAITTKRMAACEPFFRVFGLVDTNTDDVKKYKWAEVTSFSDHVLFLGPMCSKAVHMPMGVGPHYSEEHHINFSTTMSTQYIEDDGVIIAMFCQQDQTTENGVERIRYYNSGYNNAIWIHPPDL